MTHIIIQFIVGSVEKSSCISQKALMVVFIIVLAVKKRMEKT